MKLRHNPQPFNAPEQQTLFDWDALRDFLAPTPAASIIANRFGLPMHHARLICELAGLVRQ